MRIISPKFDFCFKELMRNQIILRHLISDALDIPVDTMRSVRLMNTFLWKRYRWQMCWILPMCINLRQEIPIFLKLTGISIPKYGAEDTMALPMGCRIVRLLRIAKSNVL